MCGSPRRSRWARSVVRRPRSPWNVAAVYDHRDDVRRASATALDRLNTKAKTAASLGAVARRGFAARGAAARRLATFAALELVAFTVRQPAPGNRTDAG